MERALRYLALFVTAVYITAVGWLTLFAYGAERQTVAAFVQVLMLSAITFSPMLLVGPVPFSLYKLWSRFRK